MTVLLVILLEMAAQDPKNPKGGSVAIEPVETWCGRSSKIAGGCTFRREIDAKGWEALWKEHAGPEQKPPPVDFTKNMVLFLMVRTKEVDGRGPIIDLIKTQTEIRFILDPRIVRRGVFFPTDQEYCSWAVIPRAREKVEFYFEEEKAGTLAALKE
jgi:hypothetical protein